MPGLSAREIGDLLAPYGAVEPGVLEQFRTYLQLLARWNAKTNLTAIREEREIVRRHFGESVFAAGLISGNSRTLLDFGSGAGFPGLPIKLARPEVRVVLAESQGKKAAFLREVARTLGLEVEVWAGRVEAMPAARRFDVVTMRAVDKPEMALVEGRRRVAAGGRVLLFSGEPSGLGEAVRLPGLERGVLEVIGG